MGDKSNLIDIRTIFAAVALHKLLSGMKTPSSGFPKWVTATASYAPKHGISQIEC